MNQKELLILNYFFTTSHGIKHTARKFGLTTSYVGKLIIRYKKKNEIR